MGAGQLSRISHHFGDYFQHGGMGFRVWYSRWNYPFNVLLCHSSESENSYSGYVFGKCGEINSSTSSVPAKVFKASCETDLCVQVEWIHVFRDNWECRKSHSTVFGGENI